MDDKILIQSLMDKIKDIKQSHSKLHHEVLATETWLNKSLDNMLSINCQIKELISKKRTAKPDSGESPAEPVEAHEPQMTDEKKQITPEQLEKLLPGSLGALEDKISKKMLGMMTEIKIMTGPVKNEKIKEFRVVATNELVDFSSLHTYQKIESNLDEVGADEKETKGFDENLEKLKKIRQEKKE